MRALTMLATVGLLLSTTAQAVIVTFGGQTGPSNSAVTDPLTSRSTGFTNTDGTALVTENFYAGADQYGTPACATQGIAIFPQSGVGSVGYYSDSAPNVRLKPKDAGSCYGVVNNQNGVDPMGNPITDHSLGAVSVVNSATTSNTPLLYAGFLWGSPDDYNYVKFLKLNSDNSYSEIAGLALTYKGNAFGLNSTITGADVYKQFGYTANPGTAGEQFINLQFTKAENVAAIEIGNTGDCCFEFTNYADSITAVTAPAGSVAPIGTTLGVPEPGAALAFASGLSIFGLARRKRA